MTKRWVYGFDQIAEARLAVNDDWDAVRGLLGGKGANLAEMTRLGIPVPPGFTITAAACNEYLHRHGTFPDDLWPQALAALRAIETQTGKVLGDPERPLLLACRSGAKFSMPGMMDTVLDIGLNDDVVKGMVAKTGNEHFVLDSYRRLIQMFGSVVLGVADEYFETVLTDARLAAGVETDAELGVDALSEVIEGFKRVVARRASIAFPTDPIEQLRMAVEAVFNSWDGKRARDYRRAAHIPEDLGTAVNVVSMVFGNTGDNSATGVAMSRNATTGEPKLEGDFLVNAQGEDVVAGIRPTRPIEELAEVMPELHRQFAETAKRLEQHYRDMQDMEFTIEDGTLWLLQTRDGKRTAQAAVRIAVDLAKEGLITREEAVQRITPEQVEYFLHPRFDPAALAAAQPITIGLNVSPGAATGVAALDPDLAVRWAEEGRDVILVRPETKPDDVHGMLAAQGILTSSGGRTSHAALVARQFGRPAVVGATDLDIDIATRTVSFDGWSITEGDWISIDGTTGDVYPGQMQRIDADLDDPHLTELLGWADDIASMTVRANADNGRDAERAARFGATGIGLCRTEHMFFESERLPIVQRMIMASTITERDEAIASLLPFQRADFTDLFRAMHDRPVIIRLLDPPLHEFLPDRDGVLRDIADLQIRLLRASGLDEVETLLADIEEANKLLDQINDHREANPMLGTRGVRLGLMIPEITAMQARAIFEAAADVAAEGINVKPEVMIPLVSDVEEFIRQRIVIQAVAKAVHDERGTDMPTVVGTMIELPRAALTSHDIAEYADFFSFGTNDLTQTTFGMSRDDAEAGFLIEYVETGVFAQNPFANLDEKGVGRLVKLAIDGAREVKPDLHAGICGEHGGDPASIKLARKLGVTYVSCSPYRVPVARLAAAHAELALAAD
ncbi:MAG: pyruvate, phosphate dikinase [Acidimicrobiales bacterium]